VTTADRKRAGRRLRRKGEPGKRRKEELRTKGSMSDGQSEGERNMASLCDAGKVEHRRWSKSKGRLGSAARKTQGERHVPLLLLPPLLPTTSTVKRQEQGRLLVVSIIVMSLVNDERASAETRKDQSRVEQRGGRRRLQR